MDDLQEEILGEIRRTLATELDFPGPVELDHELAADLLVDSVGALVLAVALEDHFQVKLAGAEDFSVATVADLVGLVERAVRADRASGDERAGGDRPAR